MNFRTTLVLLGLAVVGGVAWLLFPSGHSSAARSKTIEFLDVELKPAKLTRIEVSRKGRPDVTLEKVGGEWTLPGKWPVREAEAERIVKTLTSLHSRFAPEVADKNFDLRKLGLDNDDTLTVKVTVDGKTKTLKIGEEATDKNRFTRVTYLKLADSDEIVRLGPGVVASLDRPQEYFQQRRLFPTERAPKDEDSTEKVEQVAAKRIEVRGPDGSYTLTKEGKDWLVTSPTKDHADPEKLRGILTNITDLWADRFVSTPKKAEETGLEKPEFTFRVTKPSGGDIAVEVGKISESKERPVIKPAPPSSPFGPPPKPNITFVKEEYRYAKLPQNAQLFEIKTDKLKEVAPSYSDIRDARIARFRADDVRKVTIEHGGQTIVLAKDKEKWKVEQPAALDAESGPITELLDKLSGLEAKGADVRDKEDPKNVGLDKPAAKVTLNLEETHKKKVGDETKEDKTQRTLVYEIGKTAKEKDKVFVQLAGWPRVNLVAEDVLKLADREPLAYRSRKVLDLASSDLGKIHITRGKDEFTLERKDGDWSLTQPVAAKAETSKANELASDLARLETPEYVTAEPKKEDLDKTYGLTTPALKVTINFTDAKKPSHTLVVGKQKQFKDEYYARLDDGPVMLLKKDLFETLNRDSLAYRPAQAWQVAADKIVELRVTKEGQPFTLHKQDKDWKLTGPFDVTVKENAVQGMTDELSQLRSEKYVAQGTKDFAKFGLDKPYMEVTVVSREPAKAEPKKDEDEKKTDKKDEKVEKKDDKQAAKKEEPKETTQTLQIGKHDESGKSRYARVGAGDAIFLVGDKALAALDRGPLDLLDKKLLDLDTSSVTQVRFKGTNTFALEKQKDDWKVTGSPAPPFTAEQPAVNDVLKPWSHLSAEKYAAYGPKIDWASFGLDAPKETIVVSAQDKDKKAIEHSLALGKETGKNERFARLDQQQAVVVLAADAAKDLNRSYLDFLDLRSLKFPFDAVTGIERKKDGDDVELVKRDDAWQLTKPFSQPADSVTVDDIVEKTFQLRAKRIAAYPAKDVKAFGLEPPAATVTIKLNDDKKHTIEIGAPTKENADERYARIDKSDRVIVLGPELSKHLTGSAFYFADRNLAGFGSADRIDVVHGPRKLVFLKTGTSWKVVDPVKTDAEDSLADFLQSLYRLRADEIVAGKGADLKAYGLDQPEAAWKIATGDRVMLELSIGGPEKGHEKDAKPRHYAKLAKGDQVFLLGSKLSGQALAEFRSRKAWDPSLDAAQIDQLTVTGPAGPYTLRKQGSDWKAVDQPTANVVSKSVTDLLDALAGVKAERYVADIKGDLQLHGLQPPLWKFDAKTPSGTRTLLVGRAEGDSRRHYAAISGSDAVFVITAEDADRLLRPLSAFVEEKSKQ
jgi:hypothetical protein